MKFVVSSTILLKQISALDGAIPANPVVPILENFLFEVKHGKLSVTASDLQLTIVSEIAVDVQQEGSVAVPAKMLTDTLRNLPEQPITINLDQEDFIVQIFSAHGKYRLAGENAIDFPKIPSLENTQSSELVSEVISSAIAYTLFATSTDEMKPSMSGVYVNISPSQSVFVSTDGHRLIRYKRLDATSTTDQNEFIIPRKALNLLKKSLPADDTPLEFIFNAQHASFHFNNIRMTCRLIDEKFPDYENVIPLDNNKTLRITRKEFIDCLKRVSIYANKSTNQVRLKITGHELLVSAEDTDFANEASEKLYCEYETETGAEIEIGFNAKFLIEGLSNLNSEKIIMHFSEPNRAALLKPNEAEEHEDILMIVMPVMLGNY